MAVVEERAEAPPEQSFPLEYEAGHTDPTGIKIPYDLQGNLDARERILLDVEEDPERAAEYLTLCRDSFSFWVNLFGWTYQPRDIDNSGTADLNRAKAVPWVSWPVQESLAAALIEHIKGRRDLCVDKSRDMGATWVVLMVFVWLWLFFPDTALLVVSRTEDYVDKKGNPDALFWKIDFILRHLPEWMRPPIRAGVDRTFKHLGNPLNGSVIDGEATTDNIGRGGRRLAILKDEAAAIPHLEAVNQSTADVTDCRIYVSTPAGPSAYSDVRFSGIDCFVLGYWDHPFKGRGRELRFDKRFGRVIWWSPWFEREVSERKRSQQDIAQNLLIDHARAGRMFFDTAVLNRHKAAAQAHPPLWTGDLVCLRPYGAAQDHAIRMKDMAAWEFRPNEDGSLKLWVDLIDGRPPLRNYGAGIDLSWGQGASNSVIDIGDGDAKQLVAEYANKNIDPNQLARMAAMLGYWFGGSRGMLVGWESNGPGNKFGATLQSLGYSWLYRDLIEGKVVPDQYTEDLGWWNDEQSNIALLGELRDAYARDTFTNYCIENLDETGRYVWYKNGNVGPGRLEEADPVDRKLHGDRARAAAILNRVLRFLPRLQPKPLEAPYGSPMQRAIDREKKSRAAARSGW